MAIQINKEIPIPSIGANLQGLYLRLTTQQSETRDVTIMFGLYASQQHYFGKVPLPITLLPNTWQNVLSIGFTTQIQNNSTLLTLHDVVIGYLKSALELTEEDIETIDL